MTQISKYSTSGMNEKVQQYANSLQGELVQALQGLASRSSVVFGGHPEAIYNVLAAASSAGEVFEVREGDSTLALFGLVLEPHRGLLTLFGVLGQKSAQGMQEAVEELVEYIFSLGVNKIQAEVTVPESAYFPGFVRAGTLRANRLIEGHLEDTVILERFRSMDIQHVQMPVNSKVRVNEQDESEYTPEEIAYADEHDLDLPRITAVRSNRDTGLQEREAPPREEANELRQQLGLAPIVEAPVKKIPRWDPLANEAPRSIKV